MFISIMSGVIGEVTRQSQNTCRPQPNTRISPPRSASGAPRPRANPRALPAGPGASTLPRSYRVLAESFRRAAGFSV